MNARGQVGTLTELPEVQAQLSPLVRSRFSDPVITLSIWLVVSLLGSLILAMGLLVDQLRVEMRRMALDARMHRMQRLRYKDTNEPVELPAVREDQYHLFLSHSWKHSGQDVCRLIKQRIREMIPEVKVRIATPSHPPIWQLA